MYKKLLAVLMLTVLLVTSIPAVAAAQGQKVHDTAAYTTQENLIFEKTIAVTEEGGTYEVGFVTIHFLKGFLPKDQLPATFNLKVCAKDGEVGIEVTPDTEKFLKPVLIKVGRYEGYLYDEVKGEDVYVKVKNQAVVAKHFSWYRFR